MAVSRYWRSRLMGGHLTISGRYVGDDRLDFVELLAELTLGDFHIITVLEIHPELCGGAEGLAETQRRIGGDAAKICDGRYASTQ